MIWTILFALLMFSLIIFVHELGHFVAARLFGVTVHEFSLGMGPRLFGVRRGETEYSLRAIPIGGFCSMEGEDAESREEGSFSAKPWYARLVILAAGAAMNIILGFLIFVVFVSVYYSQSGIPSVTVDSVLEQSALYGTLETGDRIVSINGKSVNIKKDIDFAMQQYGGGECEIGISRGGKRLSYTFKPLEGSYSDGSKAYLIGFVPKTHAVSPSSVMHEAFFETVWMGKIVFVSLGMLISGEASISEVSGPVGVVDTMNSAVSDAVSHAGEGQKGTAGLVTLLSLAGFISVNIGIMNLLPIPALDGGRILFVLIEAIRRKPVPPEKEGVVHFVGLVLLMGIMVFATWNDILRLVSRLGG